MTTDQELLIRLDERLKTIQGSLEQIHAQVTKTNGRVSVLENWRATLTGGWRASTLIASVVSGLIGSGIGFLTSVIFKMP